MIDNKKLPRILYVNNKIFNIYVDESNYLKYKLKDSIIQISPYEVDEYNLDMDEEGSIHIVLYSKCKKLIYYKWHEYILSDHLLYEISEQEETIKNISIICCHNSPHIVFCWKGKSSSLFFSILSYYIEDSSWRKKVFNRIRLHGKNSTTPYFFYKDHNKNLALIYLSNNNMIFNLMYTKLMNSNWTAPIKISTCIYAKNFSIDAVVDEDNTHHIAYSDKHKNNYCIKYLTLYENKIINNPSISLEISTPIMGHFLSIGKSNIICYFFSNEMVYYTEKTSNGPFNHPHSLDLHNLHLIRVYKHNKNVFSHISNFIICNNITNPSPMDITEIITKEKNLPLKNSLSNEDNYKSLKLALYKKEQELYAKTNLLHSLEGKIKLMGDELKKLDKENKNYINILNNKHKKIQNDYNSTNEENLSLQNSIKIYEKRLHDMSKLLENSYNENQKLKEEIDKINKGGILKRIFK